ncbi:MAG TPA: Phenylacetic acid catabolic protein [Longimicrobiales bacterium]|nr:Phenylacetic acid catabolic protein [Longimicrobiales bacterium]
MSAANAEAGSVTPGREAAKAADLPEDARAAVRDLILVLADTKRLLGMRYGQWLLGAPELEAGIACASMAQDEWGHARLLYALLRDFGDETDRIEHGRQPAEYASMDVLDTEPSDWPGLVAVNALVDTAVTVQLAALTESAYVPLRQRVQKLIDEESFHEAHGNAWARRIAGAGPDAAARMRDAVTAILPGVLRWFGPDSASSRTLQEASISNGSDSDLRRRYLERVAPLLQVVHADVVSMEPDFTGFDEHRRRRTDRAPDERTIEQVRGDRNRAFLMD